MAVVIVLGPWRWMIIVYHYDRAADRVAIVTIQDGRRTALPGLDFVTPS